VGAADYERFSDGAHRAVVLTERLAREAGRDLAGPEDMLVALAEADPDARRALEAAGTTTDVLRQRVSSWSPERAAVPQAHFSPSLHRAVQRATRFAVQERSESVTGRHLLRGLLDGKDEVVWRVLISVGVDPGPLADRPAAVVRLQERNDGDGVRGVRGVRPRRLALWRTF
jgi:ATP-dependent Clp protease ATP-binding subunit ClpC